MSKQRSYAYYNEFDPYAAQWLRNLMFMGLIAPGFVDERSIKDVKAYDLKGFTQCHFFAGIGIWSAALRNAGWSDDKPVWSGSCPCQPFSNAGKQEGYDDERHLWPYWKALIDECRPVSVFGEQVASKIGRTWIDLVFDEVENMGYTTGSVDFSAAGSGAANIRQRLYFRLEWLAHTSGIRRNRWCDGYNQSTTGRVETNAQIAGSSSVGVGLAHSLGTGWGQVGLQVGTDTQTHQKQEGNRLGNAEQNGATERMGSDRLANTNGGISGNEGLQSVSEHRQCAQNMHGDRLQPQPVTGMFSRDGERVRWADENHQWYNPDWLYGRDGKWRPVESGSFPLVNGDTNRVGKLRAYGNALNLEAATGFIRSSNLAVEDVRRLMHMLQKTM